MTDWLEVCRTATEDVRGVLASMPTRAERERVVGHGEGGDDTTAIDAAAEQVVVARLDATGVDFTLVSEELGIRPARSADTYVVVDPIDGSVNAKRGIPFFSLSIAVAEGPTMADVRFGYVYDFGSDEEWVCTRGEGALLDGVPVRLEPAASIEILSMEATKTDLVSQHVAAFVPGAHRLRVMGSLALSLCHLAAGRVDAVCSLRGARSVDIAAAQLFVREAGGVVGLIDGNELASAPLDLESRARVVAATTREHYEQVAAALQA